MLEKSKMELFKSVADGVFPFPFWDMLEKSYNLRMNKIFDRFINTLDMIPEEFYKELENNFDLADNFWVFANSIATTPSLLAVKTMALILRENKNDQKLIQRALKAFNGVTDDELEYFKYVCFYIDDLEKQRETDNSVSLVVSPLKICKDNNNFAEDDSHYYSTDLYNRGFFHLFKPTVWGGNDPNTKLIKLHEISKLYFNYIQKAERPENQYAGSIINKDKNK